MIWLNPLALLGLVVVAAPILIHILVQRRAERFPFPTLRFIQPTRLAAIRRHVLEDVALLAVRVAMLAAAAAALAGPLILTTGRRQAWDTRIVRAVVTDDSNAGSNVARGTFVTPDLRDGMRRAVLWLEAAPPGRRELVVVSPLALGSVTAADVASVPADIGVRFEHVGALPPARTVSVGRVLTSASGARVREVTLRGPQTLVREIASAERGAWPIDVRAPLDAQPAVDAAVAAVLSQRVWAPPADRRARLVLQEVAQALRPAIEDATPIQQPWMADAVARIARDRDLQTAASRVVNGIADARFAAPPWEKVASAADGRALAVAAGSPGQLIVVSAASAADVVTPLLMRSIVNGLAPVVDLQRAEVAPIPDRLLREWSRAAPAIGPPRIDSIDDDDRRWLWLAVLGLLAIETWMRRGRSSSVADEDSREATRVA